MILISFLGSPIVIQALPRAESVTKTEEIAFQAKKPTVVTFKTSHVTDASQFSFSAHKDSENGEEAKCRFEIEQVDQDVWQVAISPLEEGDLFLDIRTGLKSNNGISFCHVPGFPTRFSVAKPAAIDVVLPFDAFAGRDFKVSVECDGELPGKLTATASLADGTPVECTVEG